MTGAVVKGMVYIPAGVLGAGIADVLEDLGQQELAGLVGSASTASFLEPASEIGKAMQHVSYAIGETSPEWVGYLERAPEKHWATAAPGVRGYVKAIGTSWEITFSAHNIHKALMEFHKVGGLPSLQELDWNAIKKGLRVSERTIHYLSKFLLMPQDLRFHGHQNYILNDVDPDFANYKLK